jgi:nucleoid-associated protein EbfC
VRSDLSDCRTPSRVGYADRVMTEFDLGALMRQAQQMQEQMAQMQKTLEDIEVEGSAGAGMVKVKATGGQKITGVEIDASVMSEDREMLQDLVTAAVNNALEKAREVAQQRMSSLIPPGMMPGGGFPGLG